MGIPAKTSFKTTAFGVSPRELVIAGGAGFIGLAVLAVPIGSIFLRIIFMAGLFAGGFTYAFWRIGRIWTIEEYAFNRLKYRSRPHRFIKGASSLQFGAGLEQAAETSPDEKDMEEGARVPVIRREIPREPAASREPLFWLPPRLSPQSNSQLVGVALSVFSIAVFLTWMATTAGVQDVQIHLNLIWDVLWR
jgi:hypothetical protein